jgi:putative methyltransferase
MNLLSSESVIVMDYAWCSFRAYYEENYPIEKTWRWNLPIQSSIDGNPQEIADKIINQKPDVFGASLYVWNVGISLEIIRLVKQSLPNCYIIVGGPHLEYEDKDYFINNPFIDFACETDGYGEVCITEFLHQVETDRNWPSVPFLIRNDNGLAIHSDIKYIKKSFKWPKYFSDTIADYTDYLNDVKKKTPHLKKYFAYESSRGCPYGCVYCEWGGGTNTKVIFKPIDQVIEDLNYLFRTLKVEVFSFTDANFGIVKRDVDIIKELCRIRDETGYPEVMYFFGPSKTNKQNVYEIERLISKHGMTVEYKIPIQDINEVVNVNIDRIDDKWKDQFEEYKKIRDEVGGRIRVEMIRGLPGATLESYYQALDILCYERVFNDRYSWHLLPTSPAAKQSYIDKFGLKSIDTKYGKCFSMGGTDNIVNSETPLDKMTPRPLVFDPDYAISTKIVVETYSYTKKEYAEMYMMDWFIYVFEVNGYLQPITAYLNRMNGINYSEFYKRFFDKFINGDYLKGHQKSILDVIITQTMDKILSNDAIIDFEYFKLPNSFPWKIDMRLASMIIMMINLDRNKFYESIKEFIRDEYGKNDTLDDLINWTNRSILWIDYDPTAPQTYVSRYDWFEWYKNYDVSKLIEGTYHNTPTQLTYSFEDTPIDWHKYDMGRRVKDFFLKMCSNINNINIFTDIEVKNDKSNYSVYES